MHRPTVGVIALVLLAGAAYYWRFPPRPEDSMQVGLEGACVRLGIVMAALWLALPQLSRFPWWIGVAVLLAVSVAVLAARPKLCIHALPILAALWRPRRMAGAMPKSCSLRRRLAGHVQQSLAQIELFDRQPRPAGR